MLKGTSFVTKSALSLSLSIALSTGAYGESNSLSDTEVTAQKQSENLIEIPATVNIEDGQSLMDKGISSLLELSDGYIPNVTIDRSGRDTIAVIRGIGANTVTQSGGVLLVIDGVYMDTFQSFDYNIMDVDTIEILKGPQSTLYGGYANGGVIIVNSKKPNNEFRGKVGIGAWLEKKFNQRYTANISTPIIKDTIYGSFNADITLQPSRVYKEQLQEYGTNYNSYNYNAHLRYNITDDLMVSYIFYNQDTNGVGEWVGSNPGEKVIPFSDTNSTDTMTDARYTLGNTLQAQYFISNDQDVQITTTTYNMRYHRRIGEGDANIRFNTLNGEVRYNLKTDNSQLLVGGSMRDVKSHLKGCNDAAEKICYADNLIKSLQLGIFSHYSINVMDALTMQAGIRYSKDSSDLEDKRGKLITNKGDWSDISPKLGINYLVNDIQAVYATVSKGYKPGGFNPYGAAKAKGGNLNKDDLQFNPENLWQYEVGYRLLTDDFSINTAVFYIDYSDYQYSEWWTVAKDDGTWDWGMMLKNSPDKSFTQGIEIDMKFKQNDMLSYTASYGYLKTEDENSNPLPMAPQHNGSIGINYNSDSVYGSTTLSFTDTYPIAKVTSSEPNPGKQPSYMLLNAKVGYKWQGFDIELYGKNLTNSIYDTIYVDRPTNTQSIGTHKQRRTIGFNAYYNF